MKKKLWHKESEEPKLDSLVLVCDSEQVVVAKYIGLGGFNTDTGYCEFHDYKWCYISDILDIEYL